MSSIQGTPPRNDEEYIFSKERLEDPHAHAIKDHSGGSIEMLKKLSLVAKDVFIAMATGAVIGALAATLTVTVISGAAALAAAAPVIATSAAIGGLLVVAGLVAHTASQRFAPIKT